MASLQVRELPEYIYRKLLELAESEHRSLAQQAVAVISKGLSMENSWQERRRGLLRQIRTSTLFNKSCSLSDPVKLIRQDRDR